MTDITEKLFLQVMSENPSNPLHRFAELVRQDEREECATLCKVMLWRTPYEVVVEARIRGRGNT
jgi:hypothetical protein